MSDKRKLDFLEKAKQAGFKIYLYYVCTDNFLININRVELRVLQNGHNVDKDKIKERYFKSLQNLKQAVKISDRAYLFDVPNEDNFILFSEITNGKNVEILEPKSIPNWFIEYLVEAK